MDLDARIIERSASRDTAVRVSDATFKWCPDGIMTPFRLDLEAFLARVHGERHGHSRSQ